MLDDTIALLAQTPAAFDALLHDLPDFWTRRNEGGSSWNAYEIVRHLIQAERTNWLPRAKWILAHGDSQPFPAFDRAAHLQSDPGTMGDVLEEFAQVRAGNLRELVRLDPDLDLRGLHPSLGIVTMGQLLSTWATHDLTHLHQLSRVLAHQSREAVGPFAAFLGVLRCEGHSE